MSVDAITARTLRAALRQLSAERVPPDGPLIDLALVARAVDELGGPAGRAGRQWALGHVLSEAVEAELARLRDRAGATASGAPADRAGDGPAALKRLREDFGHDDPLLEGVSAVYHLFLRPDLGLSTSDLAARVGGRHARTVQRRLGLGLACLAERLRALEAGAQAAQRRQAVLARLPLPAGGRLFGAEGVLRAIERWLDGAGPSDGLPLLVLAGPPGSGKSTVAAAAVRSRLAAAGARVAWLRPSDRRPAPGDAPATDAPVAFAAPPRPRVAALSDGGPSAHRARPAASSPDAPDPGADAWPAGERRRGRSGRGGAAVRAVAAACADLGQRRGTLVVVDGVDDVGEMAAIARFALRLPPGPRLLVTSRLGWGGISTAEVLAMPPLDRGAAVALLRAEGRRRGLHAVAAAPDAALAALVDAAAGHPAALLLAVSELRAAPPDAVAARFRDGTGRPGQLFARLWSGPWLAAPDAVRHAVEAVAALAAGPGGGAAAGGPDLASVAAATGRPPDDAARALAAAADLGLLADAGAAGGYRLPVFLAAWLGR